MMRGLWRLSTCPGGDRLQCGLDQLDWLPPFCRFKVFLSNNSEFQSSMLKALIFLCGLVFFCDTAKLPAAVIRKAMANKFLHTLERSTDDGNPFIVGGDEAVAHSWPWQISLQYGSYHICGGSLLNNQYVITAAHCVEGSSPSQLRVVLGEHKRTKSTGKEVIASISKIIMHRQYDGESDSIKNDIALIKLSKAVTFQEHIQPVDLPSSSSESYLGNDNCWITGWGDTKGTGSSRVLRELNIDITSNSKCRSDWVKGGGRIIDSHICVGNGKTGSCQGDSGGPLVCKVNGKYRLAGITSWGVIGCKTAGYPSVYTRVSSFLSWISSNM